MLWFGFVNIMRTKLIKACQSLIGAYFVVSFLINCVIKEIKSKVFSTTSVYSGVFAAPNQ